MLAMWESCCSGVVYAVSLVEVAAMRSVSE